MKAQFMYVIYSLIILLYIILIVRMIASSEHL